MFYIYTKIWLTCHLKKATKLIKQIEMFQIIVKPINVKTETL